MANFRMERLFVRLDEPVPGLDHLKAIDPVAFSMHYSNEHAESLGLEPLDAFTFAPFERPRWFPAEQGLHTVRGLLELYGRWRASGQNPYGISAEALDRRIVSMSSVATVLEAAAALGRRFHLQARDL